MNARDLEALRRGEPEALDRFVAAHAEQVLAWSIALGGPWLDAEDVAQDVMEVALRQIGTFRGDSAVGTWLYAIARNVIRNRRRKQALWRWIGFGSIPEPAADDPAADEVLDARQRRRAVQHALEHLNEVHREALVLVELDGRSAAEVAEILDVPVGTVYSRVHHAKRDLAAALAREGLRPEKAAVIADERADASGGPGAAAANRKPALALAAERRRP